MVSSRHRSLTDIQGATGGLGARSFLGATPERLARRSGNQVESWAVAATTAHGGKSDVGAKCLVGI